MSYDYFLDARAIVWCPRTGSRLSGCCCEREIQMLKQHVAALAFAIDQIQQAGGSDGRRN